MTNKNTNTGIELLAVMQKSLRQIRPVLNITAERLGELIGVSRQSINNLEHNKNKMSASQYIAIATIIDRKVREMPHLLPIIKGIMRSNNVSVQNNFESYFDDSSSDEYSFVDEWFKLFPDKYDQIDYKLDGCDLIDESIFRLVAQNYKIFVDYDSIIDRNIIRIFEKYSWILKEEKSKVIIPHIVIQKLKNSLESEDKKQAQEVFKFITMLHYEGIMEIRGEQTDDGMNDVLAKVYKMHGTTYRLFVITNTRSTINKINELNKMDGFKIKSAYLTNDAKLRFHSEDSNEETLKILDDVYDEEIENLFKESKKDFKWEAFDF